MMPADIETIYDALAESIDAVGEREAAVYLAKVCLALAHDLGDASKALAIIAECRAGLGPSAR